MAEITPAEAADIADSCAIYFKNPTIKQALHYATALCRKAAEGELREVVHGHWAHTSAPNDDCMGGWHEELQCSVCRESHDFEYDFCPSCGALMDKKEDSE